MSQRTLDKWVLNSNKFIENKYFYIKWLNKIPKIIEVYDEFKPLKSIVFNTVKINGLNNIVFCGEIKSSEDILKLPIKTNDKLLAILKSNMQKCIRRQETDLAIQTCIHMWNISPIEDLRRLPIIMLEDVCFMDSFTVLIWMLGAYGKWKPTIIHLNWILGVIKKMCIYPKKLTINNISINKNIPIYVENEIQKNHEKYYDYKKHLYSLIIRVSYGGMKCDMQMILSFLWSYFQNKDLINYVKIKPIKIKFYELVKSDILLESIDFHCCNQLLSFVQKI